MWSETPKAHMFKMTDAEIFRAELEMKFGKRVKCRNSPARITKLCTPASADKQQREAAKRWKLNFK